MPSWNAIVVSKRRTTSSRPRRTETILPSPIGPIPATPANSRCVLAATCAANRVIDASAFGSAQVVYNMLNPSAAAGLPTNYPAQDYGRLFDHTRAAGVGVVGIRVLAGGALSGSTERHPIASPPPEPIGSAMSYDADVARARRLMPLVKEGFAATLTEAATRFALSHPAMGTILVGMATPQQFEDALAAVQKGPLPPAALDRLSALRQEHSRANHGDPRLSAADPAFLFLSFLFLDQWLVPDFQDLSRPAVAWPSSVGATAAETNGLTIRHNSPSFWGRPLTNSAPAH